MLKTIIEKMRESTRRVTTMSVEEKCRFGMEVVYTQITTQEEVRAWNEKNIAPGTSAFLQLMEKTPGYWVLRHSIITNSENREVKVRTIYTLAVEESLKLQLLGKNDCIHYENSNPSA